MITFREANVKDTIAIAALHALSWQNAYKGIMTKKFLRERVEKDRLKIWKERFKTPKNYFVWLAEKDKKVVGFVCLIPNLQKNKGCLLDNIHVHPSMKGAGIGKILFHKALAVSKQLFPDAPLYLWVFDKNIEAIKFYEKMNGTHIETIADKAPGGKISEIRRYVWKNN